MKKSKPRLRALPYIPPEERPKVEVPEIGGICSKCLSKNSAGNKRMMVTYCDHSKFGGAMILLPDGSPSNLWQCYGPISAEQWAAAIASGQEIVLAVLSQHLASTDGQSSDSHTETEH